MTNTTPRLYRWEGLNWDIDYNEWELPFAIALCPKQKCHCKLMKSKEPYSIGEYKYKCISCDFKITLNKSIEEKEHDFLNILDSLKYKSAEIINLDGELIPVQQIKTKDDDYWAVAKISKNKKGELQLMVLCGSRKDKDKAQLFLDPANERLAFDQNDDHPTKIFSKVVATFKNSNSTISSDET